MQNPTFARSRAQRVTSNIIVCFSAVVIGTGIAILALNAVTDLVAFGFFDLG